MRPILFLCILCLPTVLTAQSYFPVKMNQKWGLIDEEGKLFLNPDYDAIGEFKQFGYAVMQRNGGVGLLNKQGKELLPPQYDDLKVLDSTLVSVMDNDEWLVINLQGKVILEKGYERVQVWNNQYIAFQQEQKWGLMDATGSLLSRPQFDAIEKLAGNYFLTTSQEKKGLLSATGQSILAAQYAKIQIYNDHLFFFKKGKKWGAVNAQGQVVIQAEFNHFTKVSDNFIKLQKTQEVSLYALSTQQIISEKKYHNFYPFSKNKVLAKKDRQLGLINARGEEILTTAYSEIHAYSADLYRVKRGTYWGVVKAGGESVIPFQYDYIGPLDAQVCIVKKGHFLGIVNFKGEAIVEAAYTRIELEKNQARAFKGEALSVFYFDKEGQLKDANQFKKHFTIRIGKQTPERIRKDNNLDWGDAYMLENFEWFYEPSVDRWGLRRLDDGTVQIEPIYDWIGIERRLGFTMVGIEKMTYGTLDRTDYRFGMLYGLVNNEVGMLTTLVNMWDIRVGDFDDGLPAARCIFENGRHGLISRIGKIIRKDYAYIGDFQEGLARMSIKGRLSGDFKDKRYGLESILGYFDRFMAMNSMVDYTKYDRQFNEEGVLTCDDCRWGYIDTLGTIVVEPQYDFARDFVNGVGLVQHADKWGAVGKDAKPLIDCIYDDIDFLENTDHQIMRISTHLQKYGLIDTLGQVTVNLLYDEIGIFQEGRLAVRQGREWGFVDENGVEIIPCAYKKINNFCEDLAIVRENRKWGAIDKNGAVRIPFEYSQLGNFNSGLASFNSVGGRGYINKDGEVVIPANYQRVHDFENGIARIVENGRYGLIDTKGNYILRPSKYSNIAPFNEHGLAIVRYGNDRVRYGIINKAGKLISTKAYQNIKPYKEGYAVVRHRQKYGYIDTFGKLIIPAIYSKASNFSEGRAAVQKNGNCGYVDTTGYEIIGFEHSKCLDFSEGKAVVYRGYRKAGLIDLEGNYIIEPSLNRLLDFKEGRGRVRDSNYQFYYITEQARLYEGFYQNASEFQNGVALVQIDGRWGIINQKGIEIIQPKYDKIEKFEDGYAKVRIRAFSGLTNLQGDLIVQPEYEYISYAGNGLFRVEQGDKVGYFDIEGSWVWNLQK